MHIWTRYISSIYFPVDFLSPVNRTTWF